VYFLVTFLTFSLNESNIITYRESATSASSQVLINTIIKYLET
jgi:hypothetical protein